MNLMLIFFERIFIPAFKVIFILSSIWWVNACTKKYINILRIIISGVVFVGAIILLAISIFKKKDADFVFIISLISSVQFMISILSYKIDCLLYSI